MLLQALPRWNEIVDLMRQLRNNIVIDCGHVPVRSVAGRFQFGASDGISESTIASFQIGLALYRYHLQQGRRAKLSICLSDTSRLLGDTEARASLVDAIQARQWQVCLPQEYISALKDEEMDDLSISLQTRNSNRFSTLIKKAKATVMRDGDNRAYYQNTGAVLLSSLDENLFAISTAYLLNSTQENAYYQGQAWLSADYVDREKDIQTMPLTRLKRSGIINLYEKSSGILCPATYGGLLLNHTEDDDHICVYGRKDDPYIGEKILRGVIACNALKPDFQRQSMQIIFPQMLRQPELSLLSSNELKNTGNTGNSINTEHTYDRLLEQMRQKGIFQTMKFYCDQNQLEESKV